MFGRRERQPEPERDALVKKLGVNRPLNHWTYADPGLPCDVCEAPMSVERTETRCTQCVDMMRILTAAVAAEVAA